MYRNYNLLHTCKMSCQKKRAVHKAIVISVSAAVIALTAASTVHAKRKHPERYYQARWCSSQSGITEVVFPDRTRCDCLTATHAVEFDFGGKWAEAIGQSLYYSLQTGKRAGIALILERPGDYKYWLRLNSVIRANDLPIDTWKVMP